MDDPSRRSRKSSGTRAESLLEQSVFCLDECLGKKLAAELRGVGLRVEIHQDHFASDMPDTEWLRVIGERGWISLSKDKAIKRVPEELEAVKVFKVRMFVLTRGKYNGDEMAGIFIANLLDMGRTLKRHKPPFIARVSRNGIKMTNLGLEEEAG